MEEQYLIFQVACEQYGLGILGIREIIEYGEITAVPMMPKCILGVMNLRGSVVPVIDLSARFGKGPSKPGRRACVVIVEAPAQSASALAGILVDSVSEVMDLGKGMVEPAPSFGAGIRTDFILGMGKKSDGKFVILLDSAKVLSEEELAGLGQAAC